MGVPAELAPCHVEVDDCPEKEKESQVRESLQMEREGRLVYYNYKDVPEE